MHFQIHVNFQTCLLEAFLPTDSIAYCSCFFFISSFAFPMTSYQTLIHFTTIYGAPIMCQKV